MHHVAALAGVFHHPVAGVVDEVNVVAGAAGHHIGIAAAVDDIGRAVARDRIGQGVAGAVERRCAGKHEVLDVGHPSQREAHRALHRVSALVGQLDDGIGVAVDHVGVVVGATDQNVDAGAAIKSVVPGETGQRVVGAVAGDDVVELVAGAACAVQIDRDGDRAPRGVFGEGEVFDVGNRSQRKADRALHRVSALVGQLSDGIGAAVDHEGVVAGTTDQCVDAGAAVKGVAAGAAIEQVVAAEAGKHVVAVVAGEDIVEVVAGAGQASGTARQLQVFDERGERVIDACDDLVDGAAEVKRQAKAAGSGGSIAGFVDLVAAVIDVIGIGAQAAVHRVGADAAFERVAPRIAAQQIVALQPAQHAAHRTGHEDVVEIAAIRVFDTADGAVVGVRHRRIGDPEVDRHPGACIHRADRIDAGAADDRIGAVAGDEGVVAVAAAEPVASGAAENDVVAIAAVDRVVAGAADERVVAAAAADGIVAVATIQGVIAGATAQGVVARQPACQPAVGTGAQPIVVGAAFHALDLEQEVGVGTRVGQRHARVGGTDRTEIDDDADARIGVGNDVESAATEDRVGTGAACEHVVATAAQEQIIAVAPAQKIVAVAAVEPVIAGVADQRVVALAPDQAVEAFAADQAVVAAEPGQGVVAAQAEHQVGGGGAGQRVGALVAGEACKRVGVVALPGDADNRCRLDRAGRRLQCPVGATTRGAADVSRRGDVGSGQAGDGVDEALPCRTGSHVASMQQEVAGVAERGADLREFRAMQGESGLIEYATAEDQVSGCAVRKDLDRSEPAYATQCRGHLREPVMHGVNENDPHVRTESGKQNVRILHPRIHKHETGHCIASYQVTRWSGSDDI